MGSPVDGELYADTPSKAASGKSNLDLQMSYAASLADI
jgi:hypothetical protein